MSVMGGYVRHRDRMIQESVFDDLRDTLIAFRWMAGTTARPVRDPYAGTWGTVTTSEEQTLPLLEGAPINLIDFFPEAEDGAVTGGTDVNKTVLNTFALDNGTRIASEPRELGSSSAEFVVYRFTMAFYAISDGVAQALLGDLADRYRGRAIRPDHIDLWNYNDVAATVPVVQMSVENFEFSSAADQEAAPHETRLFFAELLIEDDVD